MSSSRHPCVVFVLNVTVLTSGELQDSVRGAVIAVGHPLQARGVVVAELVEVEG